MAYKIGSTTVINSSRQLQNIASLDSTTSTTISDAVAASGSVSAQFTRGTTAQASQSFSASAGMYMIHVYSTATNTGGFFNLPTSNIDFGMIQLIKTSTNTQNASASSYFYNGTEWRNNAGTSARTQIPITNSTSGGQNVSCAFGFITLTGSVTLTSTSYCKFNIIKVA